MRTPRTRPGASATADLRGQVVVSLIALVALVPLAWMTPTPQHELVVQPFLQRADAEGVTITWETRAAGTSEVCYGSTVPLTERATLDGTRTLHQVRVEGLSPGTTQLYRVRTTYADGRVIQSAVHAFQTAPATGAPLTFAVVGDTQDQPDIWRRIARRVWGTRPQLLVHCGDLVGNGSVKREWVDEFFAPARSLLAGVPLLSVLGNHEEDAGHWYDYSAHPAPEHRGVTHFGDATFFHLDSNRCCREGGAQHAWLDRMLEATPARWRFVVLHHPPFTSDDNDYGDTRCGPGGCGDPKVKDLIPLFEKHRIDVVFYGHIHTYQRTWPLRGDGIDRAAGTVYVQTGGAGGYLEDFAPTRRWFSAVQRRTHHYCTVSIVGDRLELRAYDIEGRLFDRYERTKTAIPTR